MPAKHWRKLREYLELTKYNYLEVKLTVSADLVGFTKKHDREDSGIKWRDMVLPRNLASDQAMTANNKLVKLKKLEKNV